MFVGGLSGFILDNTIPGEFIFYHDHIFYN